MEPLSIFSIGGAIVAGEFITRKRNKNLEQSSKERLEDYLSHWWLLGRTGHFKSTYIREEIAVPFKTEFPDSSVVLFETKDEETVRDFINALPFEQLQKTLLFSPTHMFLSRKWIGLNILERTENSSRENTIITNELIACFERAFGESIKSNSVDIMSSGAQAILDALPKASLLEVYKMFNDKLGTPEDTKNKFKGGYKAESPNPFRDDIVDHLKHHFLKSYFTTNFILPTIRTMDIYNPIYNKFRNITNDPMASRILCQREGINIRGLINEGWNIIFFFPKGDLGPRTSRILSSIAFSKVQMALQSRATMSKEFRFKRPVMVIADEFQDYCINNTSFTELICQMRSLGGGLVLSHQHIKQEGISEAIIQSIKGNVGNIVIGRLGPEDSKVIAEVMKMDVEDNSFSKEKINNLPKLTVIEKLTRKGKVMPPVERQIGKFTFNCDVGYQMVQVASLERFGITQKEVDEDVKRRLEARSIAELELVDPS